MARLPIDKRGYPVPWFAARLNGEPDFRLFDPSKLARASKERRCWVCGEPLSAFNYFVISILDAVNRVSMEPPMHEDCAVFSAQACPFLTRAEMHRRTAGLPEDTYEVAGVVLDRNPGVILVWATRAYSVIPVAKGLMFKIGEPVNCRWFTEGRNATRDDLRESIEELTHEQNFSPDQLRWLMRLFESAQS